jgi:acyl-coenzyme A synthetase/AMP-(fatty) acid ligase
MNNSAVQAKPARAQQLGNGSIDLPRSLSQPFSNTPEIESFEFPDDVKSYIKNSGFSVNEIAAVSVAILLHRFSAQDHFSLGLIRGSERPISVPLSFSEETVSADIMACFKQSLHGDYRCEPLIHDVAVLTGQESILASVNEDGSIPHYSMQARLIDFSFVQIDRKLVLEVAYNRRHIREWLVKKMIEALHTMLEDICTEKDLPVRRLRLLSPTRLVSLRPKRAHDAYFYYFPIVNMLEQMVEETPNALALECADGALLSYADLSEQVNRFANYLLQQRVHMSAIGIVGSGSLLTIVATLACMKLGIAYVSIPAKVPLVSFQSLLKQHGIRWCVSESRCSGVTVKWIGDHQSEAISACSSELSSLASNGNKILAYYYTAGRGGVSRPVPISHKLIFDQFSAIQQLEILTEEDRVCCYDDSGYIVSLLEFLAPLLNGATVVLPAREARQSASVLAKELCERQVTICYLKPDYIRGLCRSGFFESAYPLKKIFSYSAPLCQNDLLHINNPDLIMNSYLLTEIGGFISYASCNFPPSTVDSPVSLDDSRFELMVVDEKNRLLPIGALGQVLLTVNKKDMKHLLQDPVFAASFFEADLFGKQRLCFKTDDYGRWVAGKQFLFSHHRKRQLRVFDCHANLNELAHKVIDVAAVRRACVLAVPQGKHVYLVIYVVANKRSVSERFMRDTFSSLRSCIPNSILPRMLVAVDELDFTPMGLIDRNKMLQRLKHNHYISRLSIAQTV